MTDSLKLAAKAIQEGDRQQARRLLKELLSTDPNNEEAWLYASCLTDDPDQKRKCFDRVLTLNPNNVTALDAVEYGDISSCPYCQSLLEKRPGRKKKCPHCENYIYVRRDPDLDEKVLATEEQVADIEERWLLWHARRRQDSAKIFTPSPAQMEMMVDFRTDRIEGISSETRDAINLQILMALVGHQSPMDAMQGITTALGPAATAGHWANHRPPLNGIAARAEIIFRTETIRACNLRTFRQQLETSKHEPGLMKTWDAVADPRTRESHLRAHLEYHNNPILIAEPFILRDKRGQAELLYPVDPNAPPRFTANCRCGMSTIYPDIGVTGSIRDERIAAELRERERFAEIRAREYLSEQYLERLTETRGQGNPGG